MKTLKDIANAIDALPASAFKNSYGQSSEIQNAVRDGWNRWQASDEHQREEEHAEQNNKRRQQKDTERLVKRARHVEDLLEHNMLERGMFLKVTGARDGYGIREFIEATDNQLVCRQWLPARWHRSDNAVAFRAKGWLEYDGGWIHPTSQMTTHDYCRVVEIIKPV